jgi:Ca2+-binding RTX toxin-like protein
VSELINTTPPGTTALAFATQQTSFAGANPFSVTTADLNGDGRPDLITTQLGSSTVSVLLNSPTTIAAGTATGTINDQYVLVINGTIGDDVITVQSDGANLTYTTNGATSSPVPLTALAGIVVNGLAGNDLITVEPSMPASLGVSVLGGPGDDTIMGGPGNDTLAGGQGNDSISGGPGDDSIKGGQGDDTLAGGKGNDTIFGSLGNDLLRGGLGDDSLNGGAGANQMYGGQGNNTFYAVNGTADQIFAGAATNDSLFYSSSDNPNIESGVISAGNKMLVP